MNKKLFFIVVLSFLTIQNGLYAAVFNNSKPATCLTQNQYGCMQFERCTSQKCDNKEICTLENNKFVCVFSNAKNNTKTIHPMSYLPKELNTQIKYEPASVFQEHTRMVLHDTYYPLTQYHSRYQPINHVTDIKPSVYYNSHKPQYKPVNIFSSGNSLHSADRHNAIRNYQKSNYPQLIEYKNVKVKRDISFF